jgi:hypothetical protein
MHRRYGRLRSGFERLYIGQRDGRWRRAMTKLTEQAVHEVRQLCAEGRYSVAKDIAKRYGISPRMVRYIKQRRKWAWLPRRRVWVEPYALPPP